MTVDFKSRPNGGAPGVATAMRSTMNCPTASEQPSVIGEIKTPCPFLRPSRAPNQIRLAEGGSALGEAVRFSSSKRGSTSVRSACAIL
jgi:hypothetical protein